MESAKVLLIGAAIVVAGGVGWYAYSAQTGGDAMMKGEDAMMQKEATTTEGAMMKDEATTTEGAMMKKEDGAMMKDGDAMMAKGSYEVYAPEKLALAAKGDVVLFFRATWCPTCKALDADIRAHLKDIPAGVTILDVDYDSSTALKQKYDVTYQHTLVQVDASGKQIAKWSGSPTLATLVTNIK